MPARPLTAAMLDPKTPVPDSRFFESGPTGRTAGGGPPLPGVHPPPIGPGLISSRTAGAIAVAVWTPGSARLFATWPVLTASRRTSPSSRA